jgi:hypothetical protein
VSDSISLRISYLGIVPVSFQIVFPIYFLGVFMLRILSGCDKDHMAGIEIPSLTVPRRMGILRNCSVTRVF